MSGDELMTLLASAYEEVKGRRVEPQAGLRLVEDLDLDSLDAIDMLSLIEEATGTQLIDEVSTDLEDVVTLGDFVERVQAQLG